MFVSALRTNSYGKIYIILQIIIMKYTQEYKNNKGSVNKVLLRSQAFEHYFSIKTLNNVNDPSV